jgi:hypothetical protein
MALAGMVGAWLRVGQTAPLGEVQRRWTSQLAAEAAFVRSGRRSLFGRSDLAQAVEKAGRSGALARPGAGAFHN